MKISNPVSSMIASGRKASQQAKAARAEQLETVREARALGEPEAESYLTGKLSVPQETWISESQKKGEAGIEAYGKEAGLSTEQIQALNAENQLQHRIIHRAMQEETWTKAVTSLGFSQRKALEIVADVRKEQAQIRASYTKLLTTVGIIAAAAMTGGAAAAGVAGALAVGVDQGDPVTGGGESYA